MSKNTVATTNKNTNIANTSVLSEYMDNLGYESAKLNRNENGKIEFSHTYEKEGLEITDKMEMSDESARDLDALAVLADLDKTKLPLTCVTLARLEKTEVHKDLGYKSFGQFAVDNLKQFKGISDNIVRQYVNVGKTFFTDNEMPTFRKEWLKGVSVTVLCKMIAFYNAYCKDKFVDKDIDHDSALDMFYTDFIENGKLKLKNRTVPEVIEQIKTLAGKPTKPKKEGKKVKGNETMNEEATPFETMTTAMLAYTTAPDSDKAIVDIVNECMAIINQHIKNAGLKLAKETVNSK